LLAPKRASISMKSLTGGLIFCHRAVAGRLPKLTNVVARGVVSREPAWITAGSSDHVLSSMNIPSKWRLVDNRDAAVPSNPAGAFEMHNIARKTEAAVLNG
jgi:hypothetical protein